jgi:4,5-dihydroxyphthalate decarboxylase
MEGMMTVKLTMCFPDYARLVPLAIGDVRPERIDLAWVRGVRAEMLARVLGDPAVDGGEHSLAQHLYRIARGDRSFVGIPVFPLRNFGARDIYVRQGSGLATAADLRGKRVGMYGWSASGSIWYRHLLRHLGVDADHVRWTIGPIDAPTPGTPPKLPPGVAAAPAGRMLVDMLLAGDLDAIVSPVRPRSFDVERGPLVRLIANFRDVERDYFRRTRCYPPQHLVLVRRARYEANPWILGKLQAAFDAAEKRFVDGLRMFPYASPWLDADLDDTDVVMGIYYHAHGLEPNRTTLEAFCEQAQRSGLVTRSVAVDELFEEYIAATK